MADNVKVAIKVRPLIAREKNENLSTLWKVDKDSIFPIDNPEQNYTFDHIFDTKIPTSEVFNKVALPIVDAAVNGINGTLFAYGQTSSGKTYTMMGTKDEQGVVTLSVYHIFKSIEQTAGREFLLRVSYLELYNEKLRDLLLKDGQDLKIREDMNGGVSVKCKEEMTNSPDQVLEIMRKGNKNRKIGETNMNERSSRSHTIFRIIIESRGVDQLSGDQAIQVSQLNLVDLAGSERATQTKATGDRLKEGGHINKSLLALSLVIQHLSEGVDNNKFINYRDSKLTRLLQTSLGGNAMTGIICAVTPAALDETHSTLHFASTAKKIKNKPQVNEVVSDGTLLKRMAVQLEKLNQDLEKAKTNESTSNERNKDLTERIKRLEETILLSGSSHSATTVTEKKRKAQRRRTWCGKADAGKSPIASLLPVRHMSTEDESPVSMRSTPTPSEDTPFEEFELELLKAEKEHCDRIPEDEPDKSSFIPVRYPLRRISIRKSARLSTLSEVSEGDTTRASMDYSAFGAIGDEVPPDDMQSPARPGMKLLCCPLERISTREPISPSCDTPCRLRRELAMTEEELDDLKTLTRLEDNIYRQQYLEAESKITSMNKEFEKLKKENEVLQEYLVKFNELQDRVKSVDNENARLKENLKTTTESFTNLESKYNDLICQTEYKDNKYELREKELLQSLERADKTESIRNIEADYKKQIDKYIKEKEQLEYLLEIDKTDSLKKLRELSELVESQKLKILELEGIVKNNESNFAEFQIGKNEKIEVLQNEIDGLKFDLGVKCSVVDELNLKILDLQKVSAENENVFKSNEEGLVSKIKNLERELMVKEKCFVEMENEYIGKIEGFEDEAKSWKNAENDLISKIQKLENSLKVSEEDLEMKENLWKNSENEFIGKIEILKEELKTWNDKENELISTIQELEKSLMDAEIEKGDKLKVFDEILEQKEKFWKNTENEFITKIQILENSLKESEEILVTKEKSWGICEDEFIGKIQILEEESKFWEDKENELISKIQKLENSLKKSEQFLEMKEKSWKDSENEFISKIENFVEESKSWKDKENDLISKIQILEKSLKESEEILETKEKLWKNIENEFISKIENLEEKLKSWKDTENELISKIQKLENTKAEFITKIEELEHKTIQNEKSNCVDENELILKIKELENKMKTNDIEWENMKIDLNNQIDQLNNDIKEKSQLILAFEKEIAEYARSENVRNSKIQVSENFSENSHGDFVGNAQNLESKLEKAETELKELQDILTEKQKSWIDCENDFVTKIQKLESSEMEFVSKIRELEQDLQVKENLLVDITNEFESKIQNFEQDAKSWKNAENELISKIQKLENSETEFVSQIENLEQELSEKIKRLEEFENTEFISKIQYLEQLLIEKENCWKNSEHELLAKIQELQNELMNKNIDVSEQVECKRQIIIDLENQISTLADNKIDKNPKLYEELQIKINSLQRIMRHEQEQWETIKMEEIQILKTQIETKNQIISELQKQISDLQKCNNVSVTDSNNSETIDENSSSPIPHLENLVSLVNLAKLKYDEIVSLLDNFHKTEANSYNLQNKVEEIQSLNKKCQKGCEKLREEILQKSAIVSEFKNHFKSGITEFEECFKSSNVNLNNLALDLQITNSNEIDSKNTHDLVEKNQELKSKLQIYKNIILTCQDELRGFKKLLQDLSSVLQPNRRNLTARRIYESTPRLSGRFDNLDVTESTFDSKFLLADNSLHDSEWNDSMNSTLQCESFITPENGFKITENKNLSPDNIRTPSPNKSLNQTEREITLDSINLGLKTELRKLKKQYTELCKTVENLKMKNGELETNLNEITQKYLGLQNSLKIQNDYFDKSQSSVLNNTVIDNKNSISDKSEIYSVKQEFPRVEIKKEMSDVETQSDFPNLENSRYVQDKKNLGNMIEKHVTQIREVISEINTCDVGLETQNPNWEFELEQLLTQKLNLEIEFEELKIQKLNLESVIGELETKNAGLEFELEDVGTQKSNLEMELEELKVRNSNLGSEHEEIKIENSNLEYELKEFEIQKSNLCSELEELKTQKSNLETELEKIKIRNSNLEMEFDELKIRNSNLETEFDEIKIQKSNLGTELEEITIQKSNLEIGHEKLIENSNLNNEFEKLQIEKSNLGTELEELMTQKSNLEAELEQLLTQKSNLEIYLEEITIQKSNLEIKLEELKTQKSNLESDLQGIYNQNLDSSVEFKSNKSEDLILTINELNNTIQNLVTQNTNLLSELEEFKFVKHANITELTNQNNELNKSLDEYISLNKTLNEELEKYRLTNSDTKTENDTQILKNQNLELLAQISNIRTKYEECIDDLQLNIAELETNMENKNMIIENLSKEISELKLNQDLEKSHVALMNGLELQLENSDLKDKIDKLCTDNKTLKNLKKEKADLKNKITILESKNEELRNQLEALKEECDDLIKQKSELNDIKIKFNEQVNLIQIQNEELSEQSVTISELNSKLKIVCDKNMQLEKTVEDFGRSLNDEMIDQYKFEIDQKSIEISELESKIKKITDANVELQNTIDVLKMEFEKKVEEFENQKSEVEQKSIAISEIKNKNDELRNNLEVLVTALKTNDTLICNLKTEIDERKLDIIEKSKVISEINDKNEQLQNTIEKQDVKISELNLELQNVTDKNKVIEKDIVGLKNDYDKIISDLHAEISSINDQNVNLEKDYADIKIQNADLQNEIQSQLIDITSLQKENSDQDLHINELNELLNKLQESYDIILSEKLETEQNLKDVMMGFNEKTIKELSIETEITDLENQLEEMTRRLKDKDLEIEQNSFDRSELLIKLDVLQNDAKRHDDLVKENCKLKNDLKQALIDKENNMIIINEKELELDELRKVRLELLESVDGLKKESSDLREKLDKLNNEDLNNTNMYNKMNSLNSDLDKSLRSPTNMKTSVYLEINCLKNEMQKEIKSLNMDDVNEIKNLSIQELFNLFRERIMQKQVETWKEVQFELSKKKSYIKRLEKDIELLQEEVEVLKNPTKSLEERIMNLKDLLKRSVDENEDLKIQIRKYKLDLGDMQKELAESSCDIVCNMKLKTKESEITKLEEENLKYVETISDLENKIQMQKLDNDDLTNKFNNLKSEFEDVKIKYEKVLSEYEVLKKSALFEKEKSCDNCLELQKSVNIFKNEIKQEKNELAVLKTRLQNVERENSELSKQLSNNKQNLSIDMKELQDLKNINKSLEENLKSVTSKVISLNKALLDISNIIQGNYQDLSIKSMESLINNCLQEEELAKIINAVKNIIQELSRKNSTSDNTVDEFKNKITNLEEKVMNLKQENDKLKSELENNRADLEKCNNVDIEKMQKNIKIMKDMLRKNDVEKSELKAKLKAKIEEQKLACSKHDDNAIKAKDAEIKTLTDLLREKSRNLNVLEVDFKFLNNENTEYKKVIQESVTKINKSIEVEIFRPCFMYKNKISIEDFVSDLDALIKLLDKNRKLVKDSEKITAEYAKLNKEYSSLVENIDGEIGNESVKKSDYEKVMKDNESLKGKLKYCTCSSKDDSMKRLQKELEGATNYASEAKKKINEQNELLQTRNAEITTLKGKLDKLKEECYQLRKDYGVKVKELNELKDSYRDLSEKLEKFEHHKMDNSEIKIRRRSIHDLSRNLAELETCDKSTSVDLDPKVNELEQKVAGLECKIVKMNLNMRSMEQEYLNQISELGKRMEALQSKLSDKQRELRRINHLLQENTFVCSEPAPKSTQNISVQTDPSVTKDIEGQLQLYRDKYIQYKKLSIIRAEEIQSLKKTLHSDKT